MIIDERLARKIVVRRQVDSHKGTYGRVLLIGGFYPYGGAIIMSALATVKSGAGLVRILQRFTLIYQKLWLLIVRTKNF